MRVLALVAGLLVPLLLAAAAPTDMNALADRYVKLVLAIGQHDSAYVDAYYGPPEWKADVAKTGKRPLQELAAEAEAIAAGLGSFDKLGTSGDEMERLR